MCKGIHHFNIVRIVVVALVNAEAYHILARNARNRLERILVVAVVNDSLGSHLREGVERLDYVVDIFEIFKMICIHVENYSYVRIELEKMILKFAGLANHIFRIADSAVAVNEGKLSADYGRGILAALHHNLSEHGGNRRLAVSAANAVTVGIKPCHRTEKIGSFNGRDRRIFRRNKLRVVGENSRRVYNQLCSLYIFRPLTECDRYSETAYSRKRIRFVIVRAGKLVALFMKYFGKRTHTRSADAYKMYSFYFLE